LGNIVYDEVHDQYFVSNIEDGRIYRLSNTGVILDSYDPLNYDDGVAGISDINDLAYGLAITDDGNRLFFGTIATPSAGNNQSGTANIHLLAGVRISCNDSFFGSYNHWGETSIVMPDANGYGGVASWELQDGSGDIQYIVTSADILQEVGPHGLAVFESTASTTAQVSPLAAIDYGVSIGGDPKGVGADVEVFNVCCLVTCSITTLNADCGSTNGSLTVTGTGAKNGNYLYSLDGFATQGQSSGLFSDLAPGTYIVTVRDADAPACENTCEAEILENANTVTCSLVATIANCGVENGSITATGMDAPSGTYIFSLDAFATQGQSSNTFSNLSAGSYTVTVRDANANTSACESTCLIDILEDNTPKCINEFGTFTITKNRP